MSKEQLPEEYLKNRAFIKEWKQQKAMKKELTEAAEMQLTDIIVDITQNKAYDISECDQQMLSLFPDRYKQVVLSDKLKHLHDSEVEGLKLSLSSVWTTVHEQQQTIKELLVKLEKVFDRNNQLSKYRADKEEIKELLNKYKDHDT